MALGPASSPSPGPAAGPARPSRTDAGPASGRAGGVAELRTCALRRVAPWLERAPSTAASSAAPPAPSGSAAAPRARRGTRWSRRSRRPAARRRCGGPPARRRPGRSPRPSPRCPPGRGAGAHRRRRARPGARRRAGARVGHAGRAASPASASPPCCCRRPRPWPRAGARVPLRLGRGVRAPGAGPGRAARRARARAVARRRDRRCPTSSPPSTQVGPTSWWSTPSRPCTTPRSGSSPGSVAQVRECAAAPGRRGQSSGAAVVLVGHVTKDGALAGPRVLEHVVDTVLSFEGDRHHALRLLRAVKHRFGSTSELGLFEMTERRAGRRARPQRRCSWPTAGPACPARWWCPRSEGHRPLLVEVQALVAPSPPGQPPALGPGHRRAAASACCWPCSSSGPACRWSASTSTSRPSGGVASPSRAPTSAVALAVASAPRRRGPPRRPGGLRRGGPGRRAAPGGPARPAAWPRRPASASAGPSWPASAPRLRRHRGASGPPPSPRRCSLAGSYRRAATGPASSLPSPRDRPGARGGRRLRLGRGAEPTQPRPALAALAAVAPGTPLREGLDRILKAKMGALIVVGDGPEVLNICSGGFLLDAAFSPQRLSELAKMDGAIILAADASRIARANVHLVPRPQRAHVRDRHPPPHRRAGGPVDRRAGDLGVGGHVGHRRVPRRREAPARGDPPPAQPGQPGPADPRALQGPARRGARRPVGARGRGPRHPARRGRRCCSAPRWCAASPRRSRATSSSWASTAAWSACSSTSCSGGVDDDRRLVVHDYLPDDAEATPLDAVLDGARPSSTPTSCSTCATSPAALHLPGRHPRLDTGRAAPRATACWPRCPACPTWSSTASSTRFGTLQKIMRATVDDLDEVGRRGQHPGPGDQGRPGPPGRDQHPRPLQLTVDASGSSQPCASTCRPAPPPSSSGRRADRPLRRLVVAPDICGLRPLFDDLWPAAGGRAQLGGLRPRALPRAASSATTIDAASRRCASSRTTVVLGDLSPPADAHRAPSRVALIGFCMGGMYSAQGRRPRSLRPGRGLLRDDPRARGWTGLGHAEPLDMLAGPWRRRRCSRSSASTTRTPRPRTSRRSRPTGVHGRALPRGRARLRARPRPPRPPRRRRGRRLGAGADRLPRPADGRGGQRDRWASARG